MDYFIEVNKENYLTYRSALEGIEDLRLMPYDLKERSNYQMGADYLPLVSVAEHLFTTLSNIWLNASRAF